MHAQWDQIFSYYLLYSLAGLAILFTLLHMLYMRRSPASITSWLLLMIIAPYLFVILYFIFGIRKRPLKKEKSILSIYVKDDVHPPVHHIDALLRSNGIPSSTNDNNFQLYTDGVSAYHALSTALQKAQHSIFISTYLLKIDPVTHELFDLLIEKAQSGVDVRILTDAVGSIEIYLWRFPLKRLRDAGIQISFFMPLWRLPFYNHFNLRYHRKIYLIDNEILFSGSMNLAQEYMGSVYLQKRWQDLLYRIEGSIVNYYSDIFESDWEYTQERPQKKSMSPQSTRKGDCELQVIPSGPDVMADALLEAILQGIYHASERIWIITPYFIPSEPILSALRIARHRGVDVKLITPHKSDHRIVDLARSSYLRELQEDDIEVALYTGPMLHAKAILFDDNAVMLGSINLDSRSLLLNYEVVTVVYSKEKIEHVHQWAKTLLADSTSIIEPDGKIRRILENLMSIYTPQL